MGYPVVAVKPERPKPGRRWGALCCQTGNLSVELKAHQTKIRSLPEQVCATSKEHQAKNCHAALDDQRPQFKFVGSKNQ
jgi:hypothetical protein